jgi:hypothetical protein
MTDAGATMNREDIAVALTTSFRSSLIAPFSTPELRAAFEQLKDFVRVNATVGEIESRAFRLVGESQAIDREARELFEVLLHQSPPLRRSTAFGRVFRPVQISQAELLVDMLTARLAPAKIAKTLYPAFAGWRGNLLRSCDDSAITISMLIRQSLIAIMSLIALWRSRPSIKPGLCFICAATATSL